MKITENYDYIEELSSERIPALNAELKELRDKREQLDRKIKKNTTFRAPFRSDNNNAIAMIFNYSYEDYAGWCEEYWNKNNMLPQLVDQHLTKMIDTALVIAAPILAVILGFHPIKTFPWYSVVLYTIGNVLITVAAVKIFEAIIFDWYYIIRFHSKLTRVDKKQLRKLKLDISLKEKQLKEYELLVEQYKVASIDARKQMATIKLETINKLRKIIRSTLDETIPAIRDKAAKKRYESIISKASKLLDLVSDKGDLVSDISQIYNVYIPEINAMFMVYSGSNDELSGILDTFEKFIENKLTSVSEARKFELDSKIGALKASMTGEDSSEFDERVKSMLGGK